MELRQLAYFAAVAEEGHFTRAAQRMHVAQPAISRQVIQLERELGERLLSRDPAGITLTDAGAAFLPHARAALAAAEAGRDALASLRGLLTGGLSIGTVLPAPEGLTAALGDYRDRHPGVELRLREDHTGPLIDSLSRGELDFAFVGLGPRGAVPAGLAARPILSEPVVAAMRSDHPLAGRRSVTVASLRGHAMVTLPEESGQFHMIEAAAASAGFTPRIVAQSSDLRLLVELAAAGIGVALVPRSAAKPARRLAVLEVTRPKLRRHVFLLWKPRTLSPAARAWLEADPAGAFAEMTG